MRILLLAAALAPSLLLASTPSASEPIFILNCRLINTSDWLFHQHCKAQERECGGQSCFVRAKQEVKSPRSIPAPHANGTPLAAVGSVTEVSTDAGSIDNSVSQPSDGLDNQSSSIGSEDSRTSGDEGSSGDSSGTGEGAEGTAAGSDGTGEQGVGATGSDTEGADGQGGMDPAL
jgi:hypothetical protein